MPCPEGKNALPWPAVINASRGSCAYERTEDVEAPIAAPISVTASRRLNGIIRWLLPHWPVRRGPLRYHDSCLDLGSSVAVWGEQTGPLVPCHLCLGPGASCDK